MFKKTYIKTAAIILAISTLLFLTNCGSQSGSDGDNVPVSISFSVPSLKKKPLNAPAPSIVRSITINISAADIKTISDTFNVKGGTTATKTYLIPPGTERTFTVYAYDGTSASGFLLYDGTSIEDLTAGTPITIPITMAEAPFTGKFVSVNRGDDNLGAGSPVNPYKTITNALTNVTSNEPINVAAGLYNYTSGETFPLTLKTGTQLNCVGAGHTTVIDVQADWTEAVLGAYSTLINGCKITNSATSAIDDNWTNKVRVNNNIITNNCVGVYTEGDSIITNNTINYTLPTECGFMAGISSYAITFPVNTPTISGNTITNNENGIIVTNGSEPVINNNTLRCNIGYDLDILSSNSINAQNNQWDNFPPNIGTQGFCTPGLNDICNGAASLDISGYSLASLPCP